jgi:acyl-CoA thioester hydrolase
MKPILYKSNLPVRFSDLDPYGHVNSTHYLDYVISARWVFALDQLHITDRSLVERGVGFYLAKAEIAFKRPILGTGSLAVSSHVSEVDGARLFVPFDIRSSDESTLHADGRLEFLVMDLASRKPTACPDWVRALFFVEE